jgi:hypothetical protein
MAARLIAAAFIPLVVFAATAASGETRKVSMNDLLTAPMQFLDQRLSVTGVVENGPWGPKLCEFPARRKPGSDFCVDLEGPDLPFQRNDLRYTGAVIAVEGYFSHLCFADVPEDSEIQVVRICIHRGSNGWVTAESVRITGAVSEPADTPCGERYCDPFEEIAPDSPKGAGIDVIARQTAAAWRAGDEGSMLSLLLPSLRPETAWILKVGDKAGARRFLRPDFRHAVDSVAEPGVGFRLFEIKLEGYPPDQELCFCVSGDCGDAWKRWFVGRYSFKRHPILCFGVWRGPEGWVLLY